MFISVCKLEGFQHKFTKHEARMSPQFERWFNALSADGKEEVTKTIYAFYFGVVTDLISLNEYTSESAFKLQQSIKDIKAHPRFLNWFKKKENYAKAVIANHLFNFMKNPRLGESHIQKNEKKKNPISLRTSWGSVDCRIFISFAPLEKGSRDVVMCLLGASDDASTKDKDRARREATYILNSEKDYHPETWPQFHTRRVLRSLEKEDKSIRDMMKEERKKKRLEAIERNKKIGEKNESKFQENSRIPHKK